MASSYPGALDALTNPAAGDPMNTPSHSGQHGNANDAIEAIEATLGTDPQGAAADVAERLDDIEAAMGGGGAGSYLPLAGGVLTGELDVVSPTATPSAGARQIHYGTAPPGPSDGADGDLWINDGSVTPTAQPGLVCIKAQAFTAVSSVSVDSVFSATYDDYTIIVKVTGTAAGGLRVRMRAAGVDASASTYEFQSLSADGGTVTGGKSSSQAYMEIGTVRTTKGVLTAELFDPAAALATLFHATSNDGGAIARLHAGNHSTATAYDGLTLSVASGTISGTVTVYGYRKAA